MNYSQTLKYLYDQLPMFHRLGAAALKPNLNNILALCEALGNPQKSFKTIHIAGTNGKGSTSHMLASIFQENSFKTGLYTSPHLKDFRERIRINGKMIPKSSVTNFIHHHRNLLENIKPSFFEMTVALAFDHFREQGVQYGIIETGLGGRLDSTNIIHPELSIITNISWDHMDILGDSLEKIAFEKAGIIKKNIPIIISERQEITDQIFINSAKRANAALSFASDDWEIKDWNHHVGYQEMVIYDRNKEQSHVIHLDLPGAYQLKNIKSIFSALQILRSRGIDLDFGLAIKALRYVKKNTGLRGRWDVLARHPLTICDTGHNLEGIRQVVYQIGLTDYQKLHFVFGAVKDKDITEVLKILPKDATYYFCQADIPRALEVDILVNQAENFMLKGKAYPSVKNALTNAQKNATDRDLIFIGGSTFVVAEIIPR